MQQHCSLPFLHITWRSSFLVLFPDESPSFTFCKPVLADSLKGKLCPWWEHPAEREGHAPSQGSAPFSSQAAPTACRLSKANQNKQNISLTRSQQLWSNTETTLNLLSIWCGGRESSHASPCTILCSCLKAQQQNLTLNLLCRNPLSLTFCHAPEGFLR